ncbi:MAG: efflux RND transporter permease subunit [Alphaproteobacteria bacterium]|nr:efflux RND transporter permease subunit [Alphaproteobacteria bacterium]MDE2630176.1 efflux RND transporter permease subunit [Alphaproteobacteria bacterium]
MNFVRLFIERPVATALLTMGLALSGLAAFFLLPVAPLPSFDLPVIFVMAQMPGASPETMSSSVATPLERHLGAIADVDEMSSSSSVGSTSVVLVFGSDRNIDGAARDVQAAINAARADLPAALRSNPVYRKINPADQPVLILAMTSDTLTPGQIYDSASTIVQQKLSQVTGIGQVQLGGSSLPAVRVDLNPRALFKYGIGFEDVRAALSAANANAPKGAVEAGSQRFQIYVNDQSRTATDFRSLVVAYRNGAAVRLSDVAAVYDGVEDVRNLGMANGKPAILVILFRQPGANIIQTVDNVKAALPQLQASLPRAIHLIVANDTTTSIRASLHDMQITMAIAITLVMFVVYLFLRNARAALIPCIAVPLSLLGTFVVMYLLGFSLDNMSLMALTVATGFVVDDAIVVLENVTRYIEQGMSRFEATLIGAREVGFTVLAMSLSLIAVFLPILLMGGIIGKFFQEFAVTLMTAIVVSLVVSLTTTPMLCAHLDLHRQDRQQGWLLRQSERVFEWGKRVYGKSLAWALYNPRTIMFTLFVAVGLNFFLYYEVPKGFLPSEDTGEIMGGIRADQSISFQLMEKKFTQFVQIVAKDAAVGSVVGFTGGGGGGPGRVGTNSGNVFVQLKPLSQRSGMTTEEVIQRLNGELGGVAGARMFLRSTGNFRSGGRSSLATYQYTLLGDTLSDVDKWTPKITAALENVPELQDVNSDREDRGLEVALSIDRATATRLGVSASQIDSALYDAFGQRQVSTIYNDQNQYHVVMGVAPAFWQNPDTLQDIYVSTSGGAVSGTQATGAVAGTTVVSSTAALTAADVAADVLRNQQLNALTTSARGGVSTGTAVSTRLEKMVPLAAFTHYGPSTTPLSVNHQGPFVATTFSFNLPPGESLGTATSAIQRTMAKLNVPITLHGEFAGNAKLFSQSIANVPLLLVAAILTIYIVLGILYESLVHPLTILSTLPSAGVGAVIALLITGTDFSLLAVIGVILLIGIVKKNAIMMIDFALVAERDHGLKPRDAIFEACLLRFRPIMMTTFAAILGALPLAIGFGSGGGFRQPLGISIVGGLVVSQLLTLYTTPVVYLYMDRWRLRAKRGWNRWYSRLLGDPAPEAAE